MSVRLKPFEREDALLALEWVNDEELARAVDRALPVTRIEHERWHEALISRPDAVTFAVALDQQPVGVCGLKNQHPRARHAELWIYLGRPEARGRGHGAEAVRLLADFGFRRLNLNRIYLYVAHDNEPALRAYRRCGFREEGRLREHMYRDGAYVDALLMGLLRGEAPWLTACRNQSIPSA